MPFEILGENSMMKSTFFLYLFAFRNYTKTLIDTLKQAIESVEKDTAKLRKQKEPLEKKMMSQQEIANQLAQKRDEAKNVQATFTEKYDRACNELEEMKTEVDSLKQNSEVKSRFFEKFTKTDLIEYF